MTTDLAKATQWLETWTDTIAGLEAIMVKPLHQPYQPGHGGWYQLRRRDTTEAIIWFVFGEPGVRKTVAVQQALHLLPDRVPVWRAVVGVKPGLPQMRASLLQALGLAAVLWRILLQPADRTLGEALRRPGVLFLDDAQRSSPPLLDYLRLPWDEPGTAAERVIARAGVAVAGADVAPGPRAGPGAARGEAGDVPRRVGRRRSRGCGMGGCDGGAGQLPYLGEDHLSGLRPDQASHAALSSP
ncbi:hypothetical protein ABZ924_21790 [Streptomyces sp. NPDC046876]|uniref:hypothetical protein n=1 Tax=Streptomyces sp. NPDC046876 TaxID=3155616 RepID=UPI0033D00D21